MKTPRLVGDYRRQYPTWGDLAREQVRRRGYLYLADVAVEIRTGLNSLTPEGRRLFALICAERLLRRHERLAPSQERAFTLGWRPVLTRLWDILSGKDTTAHQLIQAASMLTIAVRMTTQTVKMGPRTPMKTLPPPVFTLPNASRAAILNGLLGLRTERLSPHSTAPRTTASLTQTISSGVQTLSLCRSPRKPCIRPCSTNSAGKWQTWQPSAPMR